MQVNHRQFIVTLSKTENGHESFSIQPVEESTFSRTYTTEDRDLPNIVPLLEGMMLGMEKPEGAV